MLDANPSVFFYFRCRVSKTTPKYWDYKYVNDKEKMNYLQRLSGVVARQTNDEIGSLCKRQFSSARPCGLEYVVVPSPSYLSLYTN